MECVQRSDGRVGQARRVLLLGMTGTAAWMLVGCSSNGTDLLTSVALLSEESNGPGLPALASGTDEQSEKLQVTPPQQAYLDALNGAGVRPSSELRALSIGSSVCQAHAAGQSDQAVWDYVIPMVRGDVDDANPPSRDPASDTQVNTVTADYIRIATQRLC